ncbi:hypothetical protein AVEN_118729-1 [Araneus ventricosus]|uniref:Uncharacterized protein n=1 Tax=Araneus ventricosus TaxID=182803 RepID=A0A4Y2BVQ1_ARAVE|nr:hypothetical protein AVEN_118729-1 [Araneus ventricosus]
MVGPTCILCVGGCLTTNGFDEQYKNRQIGINTPDLGPSDFYLFLKLKEFLGVKRFGSDELENAVTIWLNELEAEEYDMRILKFVNRCDKS